MEFVSQGRLLGVLCFIWWTSVSLTTANSTTSPPTTTSLKPNTTGQPLWPDYAMYSNKSDHVSSGFQTGLPFPYYEYVTREIVIHMNGYLVMGEGSYGKSQPPEPAAWPTFPKLFGVYWSRLTPSYNYNDSVSFYVGQDTSRLYITEESSVIEYVKKVIHEPDFEPLLVASATWENMRPTKYVFSNPLIGNETATCQVLIATDSRVTYAIRGCLSVWQNPEFANVTYYAATYSQGYGDRPNISTPGIHSEPEVIRLGNKKPNRDAYSCVQNMKVVNSQLYSSLSRLPPCPCYQAQASIDQQFTTVADSPHCYQSKTPPAGGSLLQLCCYNQYGHLINYTREAKIPVSTMPSDLRLQAAYEKCCADESNLCEWFYDDIYMTKCTNYSTALNTTGLPNFGSDTGETVVYSSLDTYLSLFSITSSSPNLTYGMLTGFNSSHGVSFDNKLFQWNFKNNLDQLRKLTYPQRLVFYATDINNMSGSYAPAFKLCLCEQKDQCIIDSFSVQKTFYKYGFNTYSGVESVERGNVISLLCDCKGNFTGRFCEKPINICDNCLINKTSSCDSNPQDYCPPCPLEYHRSGTQCLVMSPATMTTTPGNGGRKPDNVYLLITLSFIASYTLWIQKLLITRV